MQVIKNIARDKKIQILLAILSVPFIVKILYFINIIGIYFGTFLKIITECID